MTSQISILHLEDNEIDADYMSTMLREDGLSFEIHRAINRLEYLGCLNNRQFDLIVSDYSMPSFSGAEALEFARQMAPDTPFMFVSGTIGEEAAVESLRGGAVDYVLKNRLSRFPAAVRRAITEAQQRIERNELQRELIRREELFRQITENVDDLIAVLDIHGQRVFCSPSFQRILGEPKALEGTDSLTDVIEEDRAYVARVFEETVRTGLGQRVAYRMKARNGTVRHIESQGSVVRDAQGKVANVVVVSRDVTESKLIEQRLREQAALLDKAQDAIFVRDLDQKVTFWNHGAERLYGWTADEVIGLKASEILYRSGSTDHAGIWRIVIEKGEWTGELNQLTKAGRDVVVISRRTLLHDKSGEPTAVMNINTDITERKELEDRLLRSQRLEAIGSLAGGIAHDLNNILSPILMLADVMRDEAETESEKNMLQTVKSSAMRGADLVRQILSFAQGSARGPMVVQVRHLIKDMVKLMEDTFPRSIRVVHQLSPKLWPIHGDPTQIHQVLMNLCVNARDAMPDGGELTIRATNQDLPNEQPPVYRIVIEIADTGCGIAPEIQSKIFQPFFTTKGPDKGTGLGLSTVAGIVRQHGGTIDLESETGKGTTFRIILPANATPATQRIGTEAPPPPKGHGERILLVDDEQAVLTMSKGMLEAYNYRVTVARDGLEAISIHRRQTGAFDLVITDTMMPGMDGPTLVRYLNRADPNLKVLAVSGLTDSAANFSDSAKLVGQLRKPYEGTELLQSIAQALAQ